MTTPSPVSKRLILSYILDWIVIICIVAVGAGFWRINGNHRPFSPADPSISFPYVEHEKISTGVLVTIALIIPAILTAVIALILPPGPTIAKTATKAQMWTLKLWEWNTAWMGLALALALTFLFTEGLKDVIGKPRPDLLSRCDLDPALVQQYAVGGDGVQLPLWNLLVSSTACRQPLKSRLNDGFASFPSGHSSFSWTGMFYLTLYLCAKFSVTIPYLLPYPFSTPTPTDTSSSHSKSSNFLSSSATSPIPPRKQAAAPPVYLFILPLIPISIATYIASTRYSDFRHHGFDIIFGSLMGVLSASIGFRMYHLPVRRSAGWSWGPRNERKAFGIGMGMQGYAGEDGEEKRYGAGDIELGERGNRNAAASEDTG